MNAWKNLFNDKILEKAEKYKTKISDIKHDSNKLTASVKSSKQFNVSLIVEDGILLDCDCSCSAKGYCVHEAAFLYFLDEYPEIIEDHKQYYKKEDSLLHRDTGNLLKNASKAKLVSFINKEFKINPKLKYDFIKHFENTSVIDKRAYEKKLKSIFSNGKGRDYSYSGYYDMDSLAKPLKKFMRSDIKVLMNVAEYNLACNLLLYIMDELHDLIYFDNYHFPNIANYYYNYADMLLNNDAISRDDKEKLESNLSRLAFYGYI